jgi:N-methylhydantoinase B
VDPITLEVLREAFVSIVREMRVTIIRTAYSSILYEGEDFSCVLMDGDAQIVAMSKGQDHPLHIVPIAWSMKAVREKFGDDIHPGDMFLHNDPYTGGTHLNDVALIYPLFAEEQSTTMGHQGPTGRMFVFPVVRAHWGDVGGMSPGSLSGGATEIFQEGVRIPPIRIIDRGVPNQAALDLIFSNMRGPRERQGDFHAMIGTCKKAAERVEAVAARYGVATVRAAVAELMDRAELRMRRAISALRDGDYVYEAHLESGSERLEPLTVRAKVTVAGDAITVDLTGTSPQTVGPTNVGPAMAPTGAFTIIKSFLDPGSDVNSGAFRPLTVITPPGTIVNANPPAPCGGMVEVKYCVETAVMGALAPALDGKVAGDLKGGGNHCYVGGPHPRTGETFIFYEYPAGGTGGFDGGDGSNTVRAWTESDMTTLQPIEAIEQLYPVRVERTALREDSGGPGQWRGGLGLTRAVRIQTPGTKLSVLAEKAVLPPFGVCGGEAGARNRFWILRDGEPVAPSPLPGKVSAFPIEPDDIVMMESSGGGGFGDPLDRDVALVTADVAEGYVTRSGAATIYGAVWSGATIDAAATTRRRADLRAARTRVRVTATHDLASERGRAVRVDAETAQRLGVGVGAVVELVNPRGAPLRAWITSVTPGNGGRAELDATALRMLGLTDGADVDVRAVHSGALVDIGDSGRPPSPPDARNRPGEAVAVLVKPIRSSKETRA